MVNVQKRLKPLYDNRKLECYALPLTVYFLIVEMVAKEKNETPKRPLVEPWMDTRMTLTLKTCHH